MNPDFPLKAYLDERKALIDRALEDFLPAGGSDPPLILQAVRYSLFAGGKRIRAILCLAAAEAVGGKAETVMPAACALEMIHGYSLIHDDLPAMDNDDYRRGKPTSHKVYGEAMAILAGDALLTEAFRVLARRKSLSGIPAERILDVSREIAEAAGYRGMVGGQVLDILAQNEKIGMEALREIHRLKTGALLRVSLRAGAILAGAGKEALAALTDYGEKIGLAFQIADDILNVEGDPAVLGKGTGSDAARGKITFPSLLGVDASRARAEELVIGAIASLVSFDDGATPLREIARYILARRS